MSPVLHRASTTISAVTTSFAKAMRTPGSKFIFPAYGWITLRSHAAGKRQACGHFRPAQYVLGFLSIHLERVGRELRFLAPDRTGYKRAASFPKLERSRARFLQSGRESRHGSAHLARPPGRSVSLFLAGTVGASQRAAFLSARPPVNPLFCAAMESSRRPRRQSHRVPRFA